MSAGTCEACKGTADLLRFSIGVDGTVQTFHLCHKCVTQVLRDFKRRVLW